MFVSSSCIILSSQRVFTRFFQWILLIISLQIKLSYRQRIYQHKVSPASSRSVPLRVSIDVKITKDPCFRDDSVTYSHHVILKPDQAYTFCHDAGPNLVSVLLTVLLELSIFVDLHSSSLASLTFRDSDVASRVLVYYKLLSAIAQIVGLDPPQMPESLPANPASSSPATFWTERKVRNRPFATIKSC
jgi:hypothetical protein